MFLLLISFVSYYVFAGSQIKNILTYLLTLFQAECGLLSETMSCQKFNRIQFTDCCASCTVQFKNF